MKTDLFSKRKYLIIVFISLCFVVIIIKLFAMQIINKTYRAAAMSNTVKDMIVYPARGEIFDRKGELMVSNEVVYDLLVTPRLIKSDFDIDDFCKLLKIDKATFTEKFDKCKAYSPYRSSVLVSQISKEDISVIEESLYKYKGFSIIPRTVRHYPYNDGALFLGDVGETDADFLAKHSDYRMGDYRGIRGLENIYEDTLKGKKGARMVVVNAFNAEMGPYNEGKDDIIAVQGDNLILEIDNALQEYGEKLMQNKRGSIVAINPETGGILAMISSPTYDPNMLVGRERSKNYLMLLRDTVQKPLINRAVQGAYPPGSTFKTFNALVGLQEGIIDINTQFVCNGPSSYPIKCTHRHESPLSVIPALRESCNPFFRCVFEGLINHFPTSQEGLAIWTDFAHKFGLGQRFNTDIYSEKAGFIPDTSYYNRYYGRHWKSSTIRSLSIGQGEILVTPLQLANLAAIIGNKGVYIKPHFVKAIVNQESHDTIYPFKKQVVSTGIDKKYFDIVKEGMRDVVTSGTARLFGQIEGIDICGKTGTAQNEGGKNHSIFMAFAPMDHPKIAIAVIVENAGFGSIYAVPIGSLMIEKFINDSISRHAVEDRVMQTKLINNDIPVDHE